MSASTCCICPEARGNPKPPVERRQEEPSPMGKGLESSLLSNRTAAAAPGEGEQCRAGLRDRSLMAEKEGNALGHSVHKWLGTILQVSGATIGFCALKGLSEVLGQQSCCWPRAAQSSLSPCSWLSAVPPPPAGEAPRGMQSSDPRPWARTRCPC